MNNDPVTPQPASPAQPTPQPVPPAQPVQPVQPAQPVRPVQPAQPVQSTMSSATAQPAAGPIEAAAAAVAETPVDASAEGEKPKSKKKVGIIVAIILGALVIGAGVVAAVLLLNSGRADAVPAAISKLFSSDRPKVVSIDGTVGINSTDDAASSVSVQFTSGIDLTTQENYADAQITAFLPNDVEFNFGANEIHTKNGDLYLKLSGIAEALSSYAPAPALQNCVDGTNCLDAEQVTTTYEKCNDEGACETVETVVDANATANSLVDALGIFEVIDNEWILITESSFSSLMSTTAVDAPVQCLIDAAGNLGSYGSNTNFAAIYNQNQFVTYSTDNITVAKKKNPIYRLGINKEKLAGFINSLANSGFMNEMLSCMGGQAINRDVTADDLTEIVNALPIIYVEINDNNDFTRVYLTLETTTASVVADLSLSYPASITIEEPTAYLDLNTVLLNLFSEFYGVPVTDFDDDATPMVPEQPTPEESTEANSEESAQTTPSGATQPTPDGASPTQ